MSVVAGIAGGAISSGMNNIMSFADAFHDWEYDYRKTGIIPYHDPGGTFLGYLNNRAEKKAAKKQQDWARWQAALQYDYQKKAALEMPGLLRQGYEDAGYNALLALGQTGGATNAVPHIDSGQYPHQIERRNREANMLLEGAIHQQEAQIEKIKSETTRNKIHNVTDVINSLAGTVGAFYVAKKLLKNKKLLAAGTTNAKAGSLVTKTLKASKSVKPAAIGKSALGLSSLSGVVPGASSGALALGYVGLQYLLGKALEPGMIETHNRLGDRPNRRMQRESGKLFSTPSKRRHN